MAGKTNGYKGNQAPAPILPMGRPGGEEQHGSEGRPRNQRILKGR